MCFERVEQSLQREIAAVVSRGCRSRHGRQSEWLVYRLNCTGVNASLKRCLKERGERTDEGRGE